MRGSRSKLGKVRSADVAISEPPNRSKRVARQKSYPARHERDSHSGANVACLARNAFAKGNTSGDSESTYKPEFAHIAETMCAIGATNADLAEAFKVTVSTITTWRAVHEDFSQACRRGEDRADDQVQRSLYERATGYEYDAEKVFHFQGRPVVGKYRVHVRADVVAATFWLVNRRPDEWSHKQRPNPNVEQDGPLERLRQELAGTALRPKED